MGERVLVTGSSGAVGSRVVEELLAQGCEAVGYDLVPPAGCDPAAEIPFVRGDLLEWSRLVETIQRYRIERLIHTAALLPDDAQADPYKAIQVNVVGTANVVETVRLTGIRRLVFTSTKGIYADFVGEYGYPTYRPVTEDYPVIPPENGHTLYNDTKLFCEHYLNKYRKLFGLDVVILRFANMYGPGRVRHGARSLASQIIEHAFYGRPTHIPEGGDEEMDMIYIRDVARAVVLAAFAEGLQHRTFHIGSGVLTSLRDVADAVRRRIPDADIRIGPGLDPFKLGFLGFGRFDISRARRELGFEPAYSLQAGVDDYLAFLAASGEGAGR